MEYYSQLILRVPIPSDGPRIEWGGKQTFMRHARSIDDRILNLCKKGSREIKVVPMNRVGLDSLHWLRGWAGKEQEMRFVGVQATTITMAYVDGSKFWARCGEEGEGGPEEEGCWLINSWTSDPRKRKLSGLNSVSVESTTIILFRPLAVSGGLEAGGPCSFTSS